MALGRTGYILQKTRPLLSLTAYALAKGGTDLRPFMVKNRVVRRITIAPVMHQGVRTQNALALRTNLRQCGA